MYLAEFAFPGTTELANELLLQTSSEGEAKTFAEAYAQNWGMELFALTPVSDRQMRQYLRLGKVVAIESLNF